MQVSALSTIIAAQQARTAAPPARQAAVPDMKKAAAPEAPTTQDFAPLSFAQAPAEPSAAGAPAPPAYPANARIGSQVDIRV